MPGGSGIDKRREQMLDEPVARLIGKMALPTTVSMLVTALYNLADTWFVGQLGNNTATGAVGIAFSYMAIVQAVGCFFGHGSGNYISREIGRGNYENASGMAATGFFCSLAVGFAFMAAGLAFRTGLALFLGSTDTMLADTVSYLTFILAGTPCMMAAYTLNNQLRLQGNTLFAMAGLASGAVLNIALDPLLIFACGMRVSGASAATAISQLVAFAVLLAGCQQPGGVRIRISRFSLGWASFREICAGGFPSLLRQGLASASMLALNRYAGLYGDAAIAAFAIVTRVANIAGAAILGFGQGFQPVCGYNFGAGRYDRVREGFRFSVAVSTGLLAAIGAVLWAFAPEVVGAFRDDPEIVAIGSDALRYQVLAMPFLGWVVVVSMFLQNIRAVAPASIVAMARQGIVFLPALLVLVNLLGLTGLELTQPVADVVTFAISLPLGIRALGGLDGKGRKMKTPQAR